MPITCHDNHISWQLYVATIQCYLFSYISRKTSYYSLKAGKSINGFKPINTSPIIYY